MIPELLTCDHPLCEEPAAGVKARFTSEEYCSSVCRARHGALKRQKLRRDERLDHEVRRTRDLRKKYGLTPEDYDRLYDQQLGRCGICLTPLAEVKCCVDHDHVTGAVRGLLCNGCNRALGYFGDDPARLRAAVSYLDTAASSRLNVGKEVTGK